MSHALSCLSLEGLKVEGKQLEAIQSIYDGKDVVLWLPTGYGRSLCYQCLPFLFDHKLNKVDLPPSQRSVCPVVSPLVSLMVDQVVSLRAKGVQPAILSGNKGIDVHLLAVDRGVKDGGYSLLICAPEAIACDKWRQMLLEVPMYNQVVAIAIDEAHCVSQWLVTVLASSFIPSGLPTIRLKNKMVRPGYEASHSIYMDVGYCVVYKSFNLSQELRFSTKLFLSP